MSISSKRKKLVFAVLLVGIVGLGAAGIFDIFQLSNVKNHLNELEQVAENQFWYASALYFIIYVSVTSLSLPGAAVLTLLGGALFGLTWGVVLVSFASSLGATLALLASRFLLRDWIESTYKNRVEKINSGFKKEGAFYLLTLRLVPLFPFFLVNLSMGLTRIKIRSFYFWSQLGMLPGTLAYVNAGRELSTIESTRDVLSPSLLFAFSVLGFFPMLSKPFVDFLKRRRLFSKFPSPKVFDYNLVVIGAGSAGLVSSYIASSARAKVALIEKHKMGGDCLNTGCVPSKTLIRSARFARDLKKSQELGFTDLRYSIHFPSVMNRVKETIKKIEPHDSIERYTHLGVTCFQGRAKILSPFKVQVGDQILSTKNIIIATGARPRIPSYEGLKDVGFKTSDSIWDLKDLPKKLLVLGGGAIGCELSQAFAALGSQVRILEPGPRLMGREDKEVSELIEEEFKSQNIQVTTRCTVKKFSTNGAQKTVFYSHNDQDLTDTFDEVLIAVGRSPNTEELGIDELGFELNSNGSLKVDSYLRTTYPNILACGDVAGPYQFTHFAAHQAWYASVNALFSPFKKFSADYRAIPFVTFTTPEVARVGLSENEAKENNLSYEVSVYDLSDLDRAIVEGRDSGFVKVLTVPGKDQIIGVTIVADFASDILQEFVLAMRFNLGLNKVLSTIHPYPTFAEANKYVAGVWRKQHVSSSILKWLEKFHTWRRN